MKFSAVTALAAAGVFAATLGTASLAQAQSDPQTSSSTGGSGDTGGTTSGPATGSNVEPSTVTQKKHSHHSSKHHAKVSTAPTADGAPGMAAEQGSESGATPPQGAPK